MAVKRKITKKPKNKSGGKSYFAISLEKKKTILAIFLLVLSVFLFLSVISYSRYDEDSMSGFFTDILNIFSSSDQPDEINNWLGIIGAHTAYFFVKRTLGYFSIAFAFILFLWGFSFFKKLSFKLKIHLSNFFIFIALILAAFFGVLQINYSLFQGTYELSGKVGEYIGEALSGLLGGIGGIILLLFVFVTVLIFAFDIRIEKIIGFFKSAFAGAPGGEIKKNDEAEESNLDKIKKLRPDKKWTKNKKKETFATAEELMDQEVQSQTNIRIIRKDDGYSADDQNEVIREERKKVNLEKTR